MTAHEHAVRFQARVNSQKGGPRASVWHKAGSPRVYLGRDQFVTVSHDGTLSSTLRGQTTFHRDFLPRSQRAPFDVAVGLYREESAQISDAEFAAIMEKR